MSTNHAVLATIHGSEGRIPTEHLAQLHEDDTQATESRLACLSLMQYPGFIMDENLAHQPESLSGSLHDSHFLGELGSL